MLKRINIFIRASFLLAAFSLSSCKVDENTNDSKMKNQLIMDVVVFNYTHIPIFEVLLNDRVDGAAPPFGGGNAIVVGVIIPLGDQSLTWRDAGSGKTFFAKNKLSINPGEMPKENNYIGIHIYSDETAELTFSSRLPEPTLRGRKILDEAEKNGK